MKIKNKYGKEYSYNRVSITVPDEVYEVLKEISELSNGRKISPFISDILIGSLPTLKNIRENLRILKKAKEDAENNLIKHNEKIDKLKAKLASAEVQSLELASNSQEIMENLKYFLSFLFNQNNK